jgi:hypothetical protein
LPRCHYDFWFLSCLSPITISTNVASCMVIGGFAFLGVSSRFGFCLLFKGLLLAHS